MVEVEFVDGSKDQVEADDGGDCVYDCDASMFIVTHNGRKIMYPREFVKSVRYILEE